jgi:ABC-type branched-subunit amino acid transport system ATPase component/ABC-type branched-subunit amino acid transport system permease subunit
MLRSPLQGPALPAIGLIALVMAVGAALIRDPYYQLILSTVPIWALVALTWNLFSGYSGLISFGHSTFFGLGAFAVALLAIKLGISPWQGLVVATFVGGLAAVIIGRITFGLRGHYFALAMLAYPSLFIFLFDWMGWQELTLPIRRDEPLLFMQFADGRIITLIGVAMMTAVMLITLLVERSRFGLSMLSIKQNEMAAEAAGINTLRIKMLGFVLSGALGGLAGGFHAVVLQVVTPHGVLGTVVSAQALILTLFGGIGTLFGPVIGAVVLVPLTEALRAQLGHVLPGIQGVIYGLTIMLVILLAPEGVYWKVRDLLARRRPGSKPLPQAGVGAALPVHAPHHASEGAPGAAPKAARPRGEVMLKVSALSKNFGGLKAVQNVSFEVYRGEILGIIGPNGAGKTTLFNLLNGFQPASGGQVHLLGQATVGLKPNAMCRLGMGRTFQVARPFARMTVLDNVVVGAIARSNSGEQALAMARKALEIVGLAQRADAVVSGLTNLELRLMELARALACEPQLLLLDETLAGLGAAEVEEISRVIQRLPEAGVTVVIIEHTMQAMLRLADRFLVLDHGQVIAQGLPTQVMADPAVIKAYLGKKWMELHAQA